MAEDQQQQSFLIEKIYVKDLSVEVPGAPLVFKKRDVNPNAQMAFTHQSSKIQDDVYEVVLKVTIDAKADDETLFLVEVVQAGIFRIENISSDQIEFILGGTCPNILFPYVREMVSTVVVKAGFPQMVLQPINFEATCRMNEENQRGQQKPDNVVAH